MQQVIVQRDDLLKVLRKNREAHKGEFLKALEGYRETALEELEEQIGRIKEGSNVDVYVRVPVPVDQTSAYDRIIKMAEMGIDSNIKLTQQEFAQYVMDDWSWKQGWTDSNTGYLTKAGTLR